MVSWPAFFQQCWLLVLVSIIYFNGLLARLFSTMLIISTGQYHILQWSLGQAFFNYADYQYWSVSYTSMVSWPGFFQLCWLPVLVSIIYFNGLLARLFSTTLITSTGQYHILQWSLGQPFFNYADYQYWSVSYTSMVSWPAFFQLCW